MGQIRESDAWGGKINYLLMHVVRCDWISHTIVRANDAAEKPEDPSVRRLAK
jgi:hypothetical protein